MQPSERAKRKDNIRKFGLPRINFYFHGACESRLAEFLERRGEVEIPRSRRSWKPPELVGRWRDIRKCDLCGAAFDEADAADYVGIGAANPETLALWREAEAEDPRRASPPAPPAAVQVPTAPVTPAAVFDWDLYRRLAEREGNLCFSPFSVSAALSLLLGGARGKTAAEIARVLQLDPAGEAPHEAVRQAVERLTRGGSGGGAFFESANALWVQAGARLLEGYLDLARRCYDTEVQEADFKAAAAAVCARVNDWVARKTQGRVARIVDALDEKTRLVLVNAVYFRARWAAAFDRGETRPRRFRVAEGRAVMAPSMQRRGTYAYADGGGYQSLSLPYQGPFDMVIVLPRAPFGLHDLTAALTPEALAGRLAQLRLADVDVRLPRFKLDAETGLSGALKALGMTSAFDDDAADFSGMNGRSPRTEEALRVSEFLHRAHIDVNEEETEAAAATAVVMEVTGASAAVSEPVRFHADHPFLFLIRERATGVVLFMGRVAVPSGSTPAPAGESARLPEVPFLSGDWPDPGAMLAVFIDGTFKGAVAAGASQILLEADPADEAVLITYRVGDAHRPGPFKLGLAFRGSLVARLKLMTGTMNIMERRAAQRGTITILCSGQQSRWLVETSPSPLGESVTLTLVQEAG